MTNNEKEARCDRKAPDDRIEILGQILSYPRTVWGTVSVACFIVGICFIVWVVVKTPKALETVTQAFITRAGPDRAEVFGSHYLIQFWTPSVRTKEADDVADWEKVDSDAKLSEFADVLFKDRRLSGYRRYEVVGRGISSTRAGAWWVVTADTTYKPTDLVRAYQKFWKTDAFVFIEVLRPAGAYEKNDMGISQ